MITRSDVTVIIDTREKPEYRYPFEGYQTEVAKLDAGDYSLKGYEDKVSVERKTLEDSYGVVGSGRARFERCLGRLANLDRAAVVIEASLSEFAVPPAHTRINAGMAIGSWILWSCKYRIPVFWCGTRAYAERVCLRFLLAYQKHVGGNSR